MPAAVGAPFAAAAPVPTSSDQLAPARAPAGAANVPAAGPGTAEAAAPPAPRPEVGAAGDPVAVGPGAPGRGPGPAGPAGVSVPAPKPGRDVTGVSPPGSQGAQLNVPATRGSWVAASAWRAASSSAL